MKNIYDRKRLKDWLLKFHAGEISPAEFKLLVESVDKAKDKDLRKILSEQWDEYEDYQALSKQKVDEIYGKIEERIALRQKRRISYRNLFRVAASVLLFVSLGLAAFWGVQNKEMRQLVSQTITVCSGEEGISSINLPDGTKVKLNVNSTLSYAQNFGQKEREVTLSGEAFFEVKHDADKKFVVNTKFIDITVLGTTFNVYAYEGKDFIEMSLLKGHVKVSSVNSPEDVIDVLPNEKVIYNKLTKKMSIYRTKNDMETAWLDNSLAFRDESLGKVFQCLERKYGVGFKFTGINSFLNDTYTGVFNNCRLEEVLKVLKLHYKFDYKINDDYVDIWMK